MFFGLKITKPKKSSAEQCDLGKNTPQPRWEAAAFVPASVGLPLQRGELRLGFGGCLGERDPNQPLTSRKNPQPCCWGVLMSLHMASEDARWRNALSLSSCSHRAPLSACSVEGGGLAASLQTQRLGEMLESCTAPQPSLQHVQTQRRGSGVHKGNSFTERPSPWCLASKFRSPEPRASLPSRTTCTLRENREGNACV